VKTFYDNLNHTDKDIFQFVISDLEQDYNNIEIRKINMEKELRDKNNRRKILENRINNIIYLLKIINEVKNPSDELLLFKNNLIENLQITHDEIPKCNVQKLHIRILEQKKLLERFTQIKKLINKFFNNKINNDKQDNKKN